MSWTKCVVTILQLWMEDVNHAKIMVIDHPSDNAGKVEALGAAILLLEILLRLVHPANRRIDKSEPDSPTDHAGASQNNREGERSRDAEGRDTRPPASTR